MCAHVFWFLSCLSYFLNEGHVINLGRPYGFTYQPLNSGPINLKITIPNRNFNLYQIIDSVYDQVNVMNCVLEKSKWQTIYVNGQA